MGPAQLGKRVPCLTYRIMPESSSTHRERGKGKRETKKRKKKKSGLQIPPLSETKKIKNECYLIILAEEKKGIQKKKKKKEKTHLAPCTLKKGEGKEEKGQPESLHYVARRREKREIKRKEEKTKALNYSDDTDFLGQKPSEPISLSEKRDERRENLVLPEKGRGVRKKRKKKASSPLSCG